MARGIGFPLVVKPTDSGGASRGASVVREGSQLEWAFQFAQPFSKTGEVILEGYIEGIESTVECLVFKGHVEILAVSDKVKPIDTRYRVAVGLHYPAFFPSEAIEQIREIVPRAILALGVETGAAHTELIRSRTDVSVLSKWQPGQEEDIFFTRLSCRSQESTWSRNWPRCLWGWSPA